MQDFIKHMEARDLSKNTQKAYLRNVNLFINWYKRCTNVNDDIINCTKKEVLDYLEYLQSKLNQNNLTRRNALIAVHHYFTYLTKAGIIPNNPASLIKIRGTKKKALHNIYTLEGMNMLYDNYYHVFISNYDDSKVKEHNKQQALLSRQRNYIMLGMLLYQGLSTKELQKINVDDIDLNKATIRITGSKRSNKRTLHMNAAQIGPLIHYINIIRPQLLTFQHNQDSQQLFFALPEGSRTKTDNTGLMGTLKVLTRQVRSVDKNFKNFKQIRASVITYWLKTEGLRRAQYFAGHRYVSSTEQYLPNDIDELIEDIAKFNPF